MNKTNDVLSVSKVKIKIRKAYNDRMKKLAKTEKEELQKASKEEKAIGKQAFLSKLESNLVLELDLYEQFDYHPLHKKKPSTLDQPKSPRVADNQKRDLPMF